MTMHGNLRFAVFAWFLAGRTAAFSSTPQQPQASTPKKTFPPSQREALISNAKALDPLLDEKNHGSYAPVGWSNRLGTVLTPVSVPGVYSADRPFYWNKIDVGGRMTVVQLPSKNNDDGEEQPHELWVHSPVELDEDLRAALAKLGRVRYVVSPNYEHLKYARQWSEAYPEAHMWGCPGLMERLPEIAWKGEIRASALDPRDDQPLPEQNNSDDCWDLGIITPVHLDFEVNPFTGNSFFNEVIFYHTPSKSLITTDFYWNYPQNDGIPNSHLSTSESGPWELAPTVETVPWGSQLWKQGMDKVYKPFYQRFMIRNKDRYHELVDLLLNDWEIETIVPAHGDIVRGSDVDPVLREHLVL